MKSRRKKNEKKDFQKTKLKVGKGKVAAANATSSAFSAKSLTIIGQYNHTGKGFQKISQNLCILLHNLRKAKVLFFFYPKIVNI